MPPLRIFSALLISLFVAAAASAAAPPVIGSFTATPAAPAPGQTVTLRITATDPDCAVSPCTTGCGAIIRSDLLTWADDTGRTPTPFSGSTPTASGSPWSATVTWVAPASAGIYTVRANVADNGGMLCGGRQTKVATLQINVSNDMPPVIGSFTVQPSAVAAGGTAVLSVSASDPMGRPLSYAFSADAGTIAHDAASSSTATWTAPRTAGNVTLRCTVSAAGTQVSAQTTAAVTIGAFSRMLETDGIRATRAVALPDGRIALVAGVDGAIEVVTLSGSLAWRRTDLALPVAVAATANEIFVLERSASRISVWSPTGTRLRAFPVMLEQPNQLVAGPLPGELALTDTAAARVVILSATDGRELRSVGVGMLRFPTGLASKNGQLAVADAAAARVLLFDAAGVLLRTLGDSTIFVRPQGLAWDAAGARLVVADSYSGELAVIDENGAFLGMLAGYGPNAGQLVSPVDVSLVPGSLVAATTTSGTVSLYQLQNTLPPLAPPQAAAASDLPGDDGGAIAISWTRSPDDPLRVTSYRIERATGEDEALAVIGTLDRGATSFVDASATSGACHRYRIVATDGIADAATELTPCAVALNDLAPGAPSFLTAEVQSPFDALLQWGSVAAPDLVGYVVELTSQTAAPAAQQAPISAQTAASALAVSQLSAATTYSVAVRAVDNAGNRSMPAIAELRTYEDAAPEAPLNLVVADAKSGGALNASWTAPAGSIPVAKYRITATPSTPGWPVISSDVTAQELRIASLVNELAYSVTVASVSPWGRVSAAAAAAPVAPSAPIRPLPLVAESNEIADAAGTALHFSIAAEKRELRLQYRAEGTTLDVVLDGRSVATLIDTGGAWLDASIAVDRRLLRADSPHLLQFRSSAFPTASARQSVRRVDFVPLAPWQTRIESFNSVADVVWTWDEPRADLMVKLTRDGADVVCVTPQLGRCRDAFLQNGVRHEWTLTALSPAGWSSGADIARGEARFESTPPPVTDLVASTTAEGVMLQWTPISSSPTKEAPPAAVISYRIYAAGALISEVPAPPALLPSGVDAASIVVRSVDALGRESQ